MIFFIVTQLKQREVERTQAHKIWKAIILTISLYCFDGNSYLDLSAWICHLNIHVEIDIYNTFGKVEMELGTVFRKGVSDI